MPTLTAVVTQLIAAPKPVLCLDTCDILEIVQCLDWEKPGAPRPITCIEPVKRLLDKLFTDPNRVKIIVTELVATEWHQNIAGIRTKAWQFLDKIDKIVGQAYQAAASSGTVLLPYPALVPTTLVNDLEALSSALLGAATRLDLDDAQTSLALQRVMVKQRPSHDGHIKDSMNFEHYLQLARQLRVAGFIEKCVFVSKNRKDYWDGENPRIHPALRPEIDHPDVRIDFFGSIEAALGILHI
jgi:hypothetical protein